MGHTITVENSMNAMYLILALVCPLVICGNWQRGYDV